MAMLSSSTTDMPTAELGSVKLQKFKIMEIMEILELVKTTPIHFSVISEYRILYRFAEKLMELLWQTSYIVDTGDDRQSFTCFFPNYKNFLSKSDGFPPEITDSISFWIIINSYFEQSCLHPKCVSVVRNAETSDRNGFKKWLYFFGSALVFKEYEDMFERILHTDLDLLRMILFAKNLLGLWSFTNKGLCPFLFKRIPDDKKELWMYVIVVWRHRTDAFYSPCPYEDSSDSEDSDDSDDSKDSKESSDPCLRHIPLAVREDEKFKTALMCGKRDSRLPPEILDWLLLPFESM